MTPLWRAVYFVASAAGFSCEYFAFVSETIAADDSEQHDRTDEQAHEGGLGVGLVRVRGVVLVVCHVGERVGAESGDAHGVHDVVLLRSSS